MVTLVNSQSNHIVTTIGSFDNISILISVSSKICSPIILYYSSDFMNLKSTNQQLMVSIQMAWDHERWNWIEK